MGNHRAERGNSRTASAGRASRQTPLTRSATPGGARRAAAPASRVNAISEADETAATAANPAPYVGKRIARPAAETPVAAQPEPAAAPLAPVAPVAATHAPRVATTDTVSRSEGRMDAGRRRAASRASRGSGLSLSSLKSVPSLPVIAGVAALALSVGGAILVPGTGEAKDVVTQAQAATTASDVAAAALAERGAVVSRDNRRQEASAADEAERVAEAEKAAVAREAKLAKIDVRANKQAAKIEANQWHLPVKGYRLTATFGLSSGLWSTVHTGLDFAGAHGSPLYAVANATVTETGWAGAYGQRTILTLEDGTEIWYCHQSSIDVTVGQTVAGGEVIGKLGDTGNSTGPHLHLEVRPGGGDPVDPRSTLQNHGVTP